jgi:hypothetical protein
VSEVSEIVELAWREGVGPDDLAHYRAILPRLGEPEFADDPMVDQVRLFAAWLELLNGVRIAVPDATGEVAIGVVHAAASVMAARLARDPAQLDSSIELLWGALAGMAPSHPRSAAARAWADFALAEVGVFVADHATARRRFEAVTTTSNTPVALRVAALLRLAALSMSRLDIEPARNLARKATALADASGRKLQANSARIAWGTFDHLAGDIAAMRKTLGPQIASGDTIARILLAGAESAGRAMELLGAGLREATERHDPLAYMLCILMGSRRYVEIGRDADALITITAGIAQLTEVAPDLAAVLTEERESWRSSWGPDRYGTAEARAVASLDE